MSQNMTIQETYGLAGISLSTNKSLQGDGTIAQVVSVPAAQSGILTTRTSDTAGDITMDNPAHTVQTGDRVDLYWVEAGVPGSARGGVVGTVAGDVVPVSGLTGDILPAATTPITVAVPQELVTELAGSQVQGLAFSCLASKATFVVTGSDDIEDFSKILDANVAYVWFDGAGEDNPIVGDTIAKTFVSHNDLNSQQDIKAAYLYNN